jgi:hypothetical protein
MSLLPPKRDAILIVHPEAVAACLVSLQLFQPVTRGDRKVSDPGCDVKRFQLPLHDPPNSPGDPASGARVPFAEQVSGRLVGERLDHGRDYILRG